MTRLEHAGIFAAGLVALGALGAAVFVLRFPDRALGRHTRKDKRRPGGEGR
jgi:hypothetical protein